MNLQTSKLKISNAADSMQEVLDLAENFSSTAGIKGKNALQLRLLTEETISMLKSITKDFEAELWFEQEDNTCKIYLEGKAPNFDYEQRRDILSLSTSGENTAPTGIMDKIRGLFEAGIYGLEESFKIQNENGVGMFNYGALGMLDAGMSEAVYAWSMQKYKNEIESAHEQNQEAADELEKSIIANIADDVQVGITRNSVKLIITKKF